MTFFLTQWFYYLLKFLFGIFNDSYLLTILVVTILLRLVQVFPDIMNRKSQVKMAAIQPKLNEIQKKYENNPQKLREEQSKVMKENGVSTLSGCLPMLITLPLFFCFLAAFRSWGNEETITLMYETAVAETYEIGTEERSSAEELAQETFDGFRFLWVKNIWQPDNFINASILILNMDGEVITRPSNLTMLNSVSLANLPLLKNGYTNSRGEYVSGEQIWQTLCDAGLASGAYGDAGKGSSCSSCSRDTSGMCLLPATVSTETVQKMLGDDAVTETANDDGTVTPTTDKTGTDIYNAIMQRYKQPVNGKTPANGLMILPFLAAGMQLLSSVLIMKRNKKDGAQQNEQAKSMNYMMYLMPVMSILICMSANAAFAFYWAVSGAVQLISSLIINAVFDAKKKKDEAKAAA